MRRLHVTRSATLAAAIRCAALTPSPAAAADDTSSDLQGAVADQPELPRSSTEPSALPSPSPQLETQVDPFRIGYNMGMQNVHLETLRTKLDDNLELLKSHFHSLRESNKTNYDGVRRLHLEYNKQFTAELKDGIDKVFTKLTFIEGQLVRDRETMREMSKQQWESMQKHFDDRLENIKDTVKVTGLLLICLNAVILFMVNNQQQQQQHSGNHTSHHGSGAGQKASWSASGNSAAPTPPAAVKVEPWYVRLFSKT